MIGGMRILCQLLSKVAQRLKDSKKSLELAKILLDTLIIAVTDHSKTFYDNIFKFTDIKLPKILLYYFQLAHSLILFF